MGALPTRSAASKTLTGVSSGTLGRAAVAGKTPDLTVASVSLAARSVF
jgi:hypothetical protein